MFETKEKDKAPEEELSKAEISNLPNRVFKLMIMKMLNKLKRRMDEHREKVNKE